MKPVCAVERLERGVFEAKAAADGTGATGAAGRTRFEDWASAASFAFSVRIRLWGPLTVLESMGLKAVEGNQEKAGKPGVLKVTTTNG
jgi:hypothetical protein